MMRTRSSCGCTWERHPDYGDVVVVQCLRHAAESRPPRARASEQAVKRIREAARARLSAAVREGQRKK